MSGLHGPVPHDLRPSRPPTTEEELAFADARVPWQVGEHSPKPAQRLKWLKERRDKLEAELEKQDPSNLLNFNQGHFRRKIGHNQMEVESNFYKTRPRFEKGTNKRFKRLGDEFNNRHQQKHDWGDFQNQVQKLQQLKEEIGKLEEEIKQEKAGRKKAKRQESFQVKPRQGKDGQPPSPSLPGASSNLSHLRILRYVLTLPVPRLVNALIGAAGTTQKTILRTAGLQHLHVENGKGRNRGFAELVGSPSAIKHALKMIERVVYVQLRGQWTGEEWRKLCQSNRRWVQFEASACTAVPTAGEVSLPGPTTLKGPRWTPVAPGGPATAPRTARSRSPAPARPPIPQRPSTLSRSTTPPPRPASPFSVRSFSPSPSPAPPPPRARTLSPRSHLFRYTTLLPFSEVAAVILGRHGETHRRIREEADLDELSVTGERGSKRRCLELVGSRGGIRAALQLVAEVVYKQSRWKEGDWEVLFEDESWVRYDGWKCEELDEREAIWISNRQRSVPIWSYTTTLPFRNMADSFCRNGERTSARIKRKCGLSSLEVNFDERRHAHLHLVGSKKAIRRALDAVWELVYREERCRWTEWEWDRLGNHEWVRSFSMEVGDMDIQEVAELKLGSEEHKVEVDARETKRRKVDEDDQPISTFIPRSPASSPRPPSFVNMANASVASANNTTAAVASLAVIRTLSDDLSPSPVPLSDGMEGEARAAPAFDEGEGETAAPNNDVGGPNIRA
ncbi:hypothetical protein JCM11641_000912 [Rhodosporidiobolus odoratus]